MGKLFLVAVLLVCGVAGGADDHSELGKAVDQTATGFVARGFSGCVLVECNGEVVLRKGYGLADREKKIPNDPSMRFDLASVTKPIVAAAILVQVQNGTLKLDSQLGDLLKGVPKDKQRITIEQLLSHTSGISPTYDFRKTKVDLRTAVTASILKIKLANPPGKKHEYSNANYFLLAEILDAVDKRGFDETVRETVFQPLKMTTAGFTSDPVREGETAVVRYNGGVSNGTMVDWYYTWAHRGATGVVCNVDELAAFTKSLEPGVLLDSTRTAEWLKPRQGSYSLGWYVMQNPGQPEVIMHSGGAPGAKALLAVYPKHKTTVVVLTNSVMQGQLDDWTILATVREELAKE